MDWRRLGGWSGSAVILLALVLVMNPGLRAFLLIVNGLGLELTVLLFALQLRSLMPAVGIMTMQIARSLCGAAYTALRGAIRAVVLVALPGRATLGLSTFLVVLSHNLRCPLAKPGW
jgi:hypothetical protein